MFRTETKRSRRILIIGILVFCIGFLFTTPGAAMAAPKGKISTASSAHSGLTGGDVHTGTGAGCTTIISLIHEGLVMKKSDGKIHPCLAKSWDIGPNWSYIKFYLDDRAKFHDGTPVTAEDVKYSFARAARKELKFVFGGELRRKVDRVEVVDKHTVIVHNKAPYPALFDRAAKYIGIVPKHYVEKVGDAAYAKNTIGAGPFRFVKYKQDIFYEVEAVRDHYRQVPYVKTVRYTNVQEETTRMAQIKTGEVDIAKLPYATFWELKGDPDIRIVFSKYTYLPTLAYYDLAFPKKSSPFHDIRVRQAASIAINREMICKKVMHGLTIPWGDMLAPYHPGFDPSVKPPPYDPETAKALLKEAGYPNGFETDLTGDIPVKTEMQAMVHNLKKVGIRIKLSVPEAGILSRLRSEKKLSGLGRHPGPWWAGRWHPASAWSSHFSSKSPWTFFTMPEIDEGLDALAKLTDEKEIAAKAREISKFYREKMIRAPLWVQTVPYGVRKKIKYWEQVPGWVYIAGLEFLKLED